MILPWQCATTRSAAGMLRNNLGSPTPSPQRNGAFGNLVAEAFQFVRHLVEQLVQRDKIATLSHSDAPAPNPGGVRREVRIKFIGAHGGMRFRRGIPFYPAMPCRRSSIMEGRGSSFSWLLPDNADAVEGCDTVGLGVKRVASDRQSGGGLIERLVACGIDDQTPKLPWRVSK